MAAMGAAIEQLLNRQEENYIFPFFWQHGEDEGTLRKYMKVIDEANCHAVCVESRPHPDFCGPKWWEDMDIILDEARKRKMKVWILDDRHFPTGFANGAVEKAPEELRRQSVYCHIFPVKGNKTRFHCNLTKVMKQIPSTMISRRIGSALEGAKKVFDNDRLLGVSALVKESREPLEVSYTISGKMLEAVLPANTQKVYVTFLTRNSGIHRTYINMLDRGSCRIQIDAVYEPHWEHYREDFGRTIAGFFSDEPEIGNGVYLNNEIRMGTDYDFPWSRELEQELPKSMGENWKNLLPLLRDNDTDRQMRAQVRYWYMDTVTRLVEKCFSRQLGNWCEEHGVEYIGHMIEDNNQHARLGASLGHYFRGLSGQHMAGIDDIGGQVLMQGEDAKAEGLQKLMGGRDGEFYHYLLGKLGASYAAIDPAKQGRCMCEIFGNYGWNEGPRLEKYLPDHFMVQGINRYVPHAFSGKDYPDKDCPPHFYAHGYNPQYRHFGQVAAYMNRICGLISDGKPMVDTAVLYHGDGEWAGEAMLDQKPTRILMEHQVDFHVIPGDVFYERERYKTVMQDGLRINGNCYHTLLVPYAQYIPESLASAVKEILQGGCKVVFIDALPEGVVSASTMTDCVGSSGGASSKEISAHELPAAVKTCKVCALERILTEVSREILVSPEAWRIRACHYKGAEEIYYFVNEDDKSFEGTVSIPEVADCYAYDAWENRVFAQKCTTRNGQTKLKLSLRPGESRIVVIGTRSDLGEEIFPQGKCVPLDKGWERSVCRSIDYPRFSEPRAIAAFGDYGKEDKNFSGFIAYETKLQKPEGRRILLEITDAGEDVEVFVNGISLGIQVLVPFYYDLTGKLEDGENILRIEVATTLERERKANKKKWEPIGITGTVNLYIK